MGTTHTDDIAAARLSRSYSPRRASAARMRRALRAYLALQGVDARVAAQDVVLATEEAFINALVHGGAEARDPRLGMGIARHGVCRDRRRRAGILLPGVESTRAARRPPVPRPRPGSMQTIMGSRHRQDGQEGNDRPHDEAHRTSMSADKPVRLRPRYRPRRNDADLPPHPDLELVMLQPPRPCWTPARATTPGEPRRHVTVVAKEWMSEDCHPERDWWVVDAPSGGLMGVALAVAGSRGDHRRPLRASGASRPGSR